MVFSHKAALIATGFNVVWIGEVGKWDPRKYVEEGGPMLQALEKYIDQALYRYNKSIEIRLADELHCGSMSLKLDLLRM